MQLAAKGQVEAPAHPEHELQCRTDTSQFKDLPPELRPYKPDQGLKAELKASSAKGFDMAIGRATDFRMLMHVTVNPSR